MYGMSNVMDHHQRLCFTALLETGWTHKGTHYCPQAFLLVHWSIHKGINNLFALKFVIKLINELEKVNLKVI